MTHRLWGGLFALAFVAILPRTLHAQSPPQPVLSAGQSDSICTYDRCALWLDARGLRQGAEGHLLARQRWFRPLPLRRFVSGDSAGHYATRYESDARRGTALALVGGLALAASVAIACADDCGIRGIGRQMSNEAAAAAFTLALVGMAIDIVGQRRIDSATRALGRAMWWHNRQFAR